MDEWGSDKYNRFLLFKSEYPDVFKIDSICSDNNTIDYDIDILYIINKIKYYYGLNDRYRYIKFVNNVHRFAIHTSTILREPEFLWDMLIKYNGSVKDYTIYDYRKWRIKKLLKH